VTATLALALGITTRDPSRPGAGCEASVRDAAATSHDYVDPTPRNVSTAGGVGAAFVQLETPVAQVERFVADLPAGTDLVLRFGGAVAEVLGTSAATGFSGGETAVLAIDAGGNVTVTFESTDTTQALAAKRINWALGAQVADTDSDGKLRLRSLRTGDAGAAAKGYAYGRVRVVSGSALAGLGLVAGDTYGQGDDQRVGSGLFAKTFPAGALPRRVELSGSAQGAKFWVAGKAN
jgi:hypothetical protein